MIKLYFFKIEITITMFKFIFTLPLFFILSSMYSQKLYLLGGMNQSRFDLDYQQANTFYSSGYVRDVYRNSSLGFNVSLGAEFWDKNVFSFLCLVQYNQLGGSMGDSKIEKDIQRDWGFTDKFKFGQLSLNPMFKYKWVNKERVNLFLVSGLRLDYVLNVSQFTNSLSTLNYLVIYEQYLNRLNLGLNLGLGGEYKLSNKFGLTAMLTYNQHITKMSHENQTMSNVTNGQLNWNFSSHVNYYQFLLGMSYCISKK